MIASKALDKDKVFLMLNEIGNICNNRNDLYSFYFSYACFEFKFLFLNFSSCIIYIFTVFTEFYKL